MSACSSIASKDEHRIRGLSTLNPTPMHNVLLCTAEKKGLCCCSGLCMIIPSVIFPRSEENEQRQESAWIHVEKTHYVQDTAQAAGTEQVKRQMFVKF